MNNIIGKYNPLSILYNSTFNLIWGESYSKSSCLIKKPPSKFIENINLLIFDMDGVLRIGTDPIELARNTFNNLVETEVPICIVTNECRRTSKTIGKELKNMGYNINSNIKIFSAGQLMLTKIIEIIENNLKQQSSQKKMSFGIIGEQSFYQFISQNIYNKYGMNSINFYWIYEKVKPNNIDYFVVGCLSNQIPEILEKHIDRLNNWITGNVTANYLLTCPDTKDVENLDKILNVSPKMIIQLITDKQLSIQKTMKNIDEIENSKSLINHIKTHIEIPSKPNTTLFKKEIETHYGVKFENENKNETKSSILMVGDNIKTDIQFANNLNIHSCLVLTGVTSYDNLKNATIQKNNIDFIIPDISYLLSV